MKKKDVKKLIDKEIKKALQQPDEEAKQEMQNSSGEENLQAPRVASSGGRVALTAGKQHQPMFDGRAGA
ncbi:MAG TPA: hypothetical protein V6C89_18140 [Drouetiella sp.]|jgi:hypothetical protein